MSIESTYYIKRLDAIKMLSDVGVILYPPSVTNHQLENYLYDHRSSIFENYSVVNKIPDDIEKERIKTNW